MPLYCQLYYPVGGAECIDCRWRFEDLCWTPPRMPKSGIPLEKILTPEEKIEYLKAEMEARFDDLSKQIQQNDVSGKALPTRKTNPVVRGGAML